MSTESQEKRPQHPYCRCVWFPQKKAKSIIPWLVGIMLVVSIVYPFYVIMTECRPLWLDTPTPSGHYRLKYTCHNCHQWFRVYIPQGEPGKRGKMCPYCHATDSGVLYYGQY